jgi:hypothetical protein
VAPLQEAFAADPPRAELPPLTTTIPPEEALAAIKRRAQKILEARREARKLKFSGQASQGVAYETNPNNTTHHKGDTSSETTAYLMFSKKLTNTVDWQGTYYGSYLKYVDFGDLDYTSHTLTPAKLRWRPGKVWRLEGWMDLDYNYYPVGQSSSYRQLKFATRARQNILEDSYHQLQYEWYVRDHISKEARNGAGADTFSRRVDTRSRVRYKVGSTVMKTLLSAEGQFYWNDSNDERFNFYDYEVWRTSFDASGNLTKKLQLSGSYAFERKNYDVRPVTGINAEARYDDKYTLSATASYTVNPTWTVDTRLTYDDLQSNESTGEFTNGKVALTATAKF